MRETVRVASDQPDEAFKWLLVYQGGHARIPEGNRQVFDLGH